MKRAGEDREKENKETPCTPNLRERLPEAKVTSILYEISLGPIQSDWGRISIEFATYRARPVVSKGMCAMACLPVSET